MLVRNYVGNRKWLNGVIKSQTGPVSFKVLVNGQLRHCHIDQLKLRLCNANSNSRDTDSPDSGLEEVDLPTPPVSDNRPPADAPSSQAPLVRVYPRRHNRGLPPICYEPGTTDT